MVKQTKTNEKKMNPFLWFLCAIVIPVVVALTLMVIILSVSGVDVGGWAKQTGKNIPVIGALFSSDETEDSTEMEEKTKAELSGKDEEIQALTEQINSLEKTLEDVERKNTKLEHQNKKQDEEVEQKEQTREIQDPIDTLSKSFKEMNTKQAAQILKELDDDIAVSLLRELPTDVRGDILGKMDPETAAKMTKLFLQQ